MTVAGIALAGYTAVVVICTATVLLRPEPTLVRGRSILLFSTLYVVLTWGLLAWLERAVSPSALILGAAALAVSAAVAPWWFVLGGPHSAVLATMEICFGRICAQYERVGAGFVMKVPGGGLEVALHALPTGRVTVLSFRARPAHKKSELFRSLLAKQYPGMLPTVRIRIK